MTHPPDSGFKQPLSVTQHTKHIQEVLVISPALLTKIVEMSCAQTPVRWLELGHLATGDYSSWPPALGTHRDTVFMCSLVAIPEYTGNQLAEAVCAPSGRFCIWDESRAIIHEPAVKAHAQKAFPVTHAQRAAHMNHEERVYCCKQ